MNLINTVTQGDIFDVDLKQANNISFSSLDRKQCHV